MGKYNIQSKSVAWQIPSSKTFQGNNTSTPLKVGSPGIFSIPYGGNKSTVLNYLIVSSPENFIDRRVRYIVAHQHMINPADPRYGAYMVYDHEGDSIFYQSQGFCSPF